MTPTTEQLNDECAVGLLRLLKPTLDARTAFKSPRLSVQRNLDQLRTYWALSSTVNSLAEFVVGYPRAIQTTIDEVQIDSSLITGHIRAAESVIEQIRRSDVCYYSVDEPSSSIYWPPNSVVAWVLKDALRLLVAADRQYGLSNRLEWFHHRLLALVKANSNKSIRELTFGPLRLKRPDKNALRWCGRSNSALYRLALVAFNDVNGLERGDESVAKQILFSSLLPTLEDWRRFELVTLIAVSEALEEALGMPATLSMPLTANSRCVSIGDFEIRWQNDLPIRDVENLTGSELLSREMLASLRLASTSNIADLTIFCKGAPVAVVECKWFSDPTGSRAATRKAVDQIASYSFDLVAGSPFEAKTIASRSLIAVASLDGINAKLDGATGPFLADFAAMRDKLLVTWATQLIASA